MLPDVPWFTRAVTVSCAASPASIHPFCVNVTSPELCEHPHVPCAGTGEPQPRKVTPAGSRSWTTTLFAAPAVAPVATLFTSIVYVMVCPGATSARPSLFAIVRAGVGGWT